MRLGNILSTLVLFLLLSSTSMADPAKRDVLTAMENAAKYMMENVSTNGGFVWYYTSDLSKRWGEVPARESQIWMQRGTNDVGEMFLSLFRITGDERYLGYAKRVANAVIWGQYPGGGWHYLTDFDMPGIQRWYDNVASKCWGWEEYYHFYSNATYDNDVTTSSTRFLLHYYMETFDPSYRSALLKGLGVILDSQFLNGAWPQRYPLKAEYSKDGIPDYSVMYTLNDGVAASNIRLLVEAYKLLGENRYMEAARRGMDFYLIAQGPEGEGAWAEQYDFDLHPTYARTYEPGAWHSSRTAECIDELLYFYLVTGDRRYLDAVPSALDWLTQTGINSDPDKKAHRDGNLYSYTHAVYYETGTNQPLYVHREGSSIEDGRYWTDKKFGNAPCHVRQVAVIDIDALKKRYQRIASLISAQDRNAYLNREKRALKPDVAAIDKILKSQEKNGRWISDIDIPNYTDPCDRSGWKRIRGISTRVFINNMKALAEYVGE